MIKSIRSLLNPSIRIDMENSVQSSIYRLNSINLIIGDNGSGKTRLIRSIIGDLCKLGSESHFMTDGDTDGLGIIYYTAAPFHQRMLPSRAESVSLVDASQNNGQKHNFLKAAQEFVQVRELLNLSTSNSVKRVDNFDWLTERLLSGYSSYSAMDQWGNPKILDWYNEHRRLSSVVIRLTKERNSALRKLEENSGDLQKSILPIDAEGDFFRNKASALNEEIERTKLAILALKESINLEFLKNCKPKSRKHALEWLVLSSFLNSGKAGSIKRRQEIVKYFYTRNYEFDGPTAQEWQRISSIVNAFVNTLEKEEIGRFEWDSNHCSLEVSLPQLVTSTIPESLIEAAQSLGLVRLGFETMSSGEAAITHQLASISTCIHQLAESGRDRILVFIDEGDLLLHLRWQRKYLSLVDLRLSTIRDVLGLKSVQVIVATHSPLLTSDVIKGAILKLGEGITTGFGAPLQRIVNYSFGTPAIGEIAERTIESLNSKVELSELDFAVVDEIDDPFVRDLLKSKK